MGRFRHIRVGRIENHELEIRRRFGAWMDCICCLRVIDMLHRVRVSQSVAGTRREWLLEDGLIIFEVSSAEEVGGAECSQSLRLGTAQESISEEVVHRSSVVDDCSLGAAS